MELRAGLPLLAVFTLLASGSVVAGETIEFSAIHTLKVDDVQSGPVGDNADHVLFLVKSSGTNKSTGKVTFLDGATETEVVTGDGEKGSGHHHGYIFFKAADGTLLNEFDGYGTIMTIEGKPKSLGMGSWYTVSGTGRYANGSGVGTYRSVLNVPTFDGSTDWDGTFTEGAR